MHKNSKDLEKVRQAYLEAFSKFNKFKKSFNKNMSLVLSEDAEQTTKSFASFNDLLSEWDTNSELRTVGIENFVNKLNHSLSDIIEAHKNLVIRANNLKDPSMVQNIKNYLSEAVKSITALCAAVTEFISSLSQKTTKAISTSFNSFKESIKTIKVPTLERINSTKPAGPKKE